MKKIICILLSFFTIFIVSCTPKQQNEKPEFKPDSVEYVIYLGESDLSALATDESELGITDTQNKSSITGKALPDDCDFVYMPTNMPDNEKAPKIKDFSILEKSYQLEYNRSQTNSLASSSVQRLRKYGLTDEYRSDDYIVKFTQESGELRYYSDHTVDELATGSFTQQDAIEASKRVLTEQFGKECLEYYTADPMVTETVDGYMYNIYVVTYTKYIAGYRTNDMITLWYNKCGELACINANNYGLIKEATDKYSAEQLQTAEKTLTDYLDSMSYAYTAEMIKLMINSDGECYFQLYGIYSVGEESRMRAFYINIE
jgi:hypothetical protein